ncbi:MAG TPA: hypothetical protein VJM34_01465 [Novosphingobium sp.]|nr:hypothetical protein [Novosphingobium sp.]
MTKQLEGITFRASPALVVVSSGVAASIQAPSLRPRAGSGFPASLDRKLSIAR